MEFVIAHHQTLNMLERVQANTRPDGWMAYIRNHPEFECSTVDEWVDKYPNYAGSLLICPVH